MQARKTPDRLAVVYDQEYLTYQQLNEQSNQLAHYLRRNGVGPEYRVGLFIERSVEWIIGMLGIIKAGGVYVPLDTSYPEERLSAIFASARMTMCLTQQKHVAKLATIKTTPICLELVGEQVKKESSENPLTNSDAHNLMYIIYTSGSTGKPKGVAIEHHSVAHLAHELWRQIYQYLPEHLHISLNGPLVFDTSVKQFIQLLYGHTIHIIPQQVRFDKDAFLLYIKEHTINVLDCTPSHLKLLSQQNDVAFEPSLHTILVGGEAIDEHMWRNIANDSSRTYFNVYGPTECTVDTTIYKINKHRGRPTIGLPIANVEIYVLDEQLLPAPAQTIGEVYISGPGLARGYLGQADSTAVAFLPDPFSAQPGMRLYKSGDLGYIAEDGMIELVGRADMQVKIQGFRVDIHEIEVLLEMHSAIRSAAIVAQESSEGQTYLVGFIVFVADPVSENDLARYISTYVPDYMLPSTFIPIDMIPLTTNGKTDYQALLHLANEHVTTSQQSDNAPQSTVEQQIALLWMQLLGMASVGINDNFFVAGGNSLTATRLAAMLANLYELDISIRTIWQSPTIARLAIAIEDLLIEAIDAMSDEDVSTYLQYN